MITVLQARFVDGNYVLNIITILSVCFYSGLFKMNFVLAVSLINLSFISKTRIQAAEPELNVWQGRERITVEQMKSTIFEILSV